MKENNSERADILVQLLRTNANKVYWAESLLNIVRTAKNSRGANRSRELARLESEILKGLIKDSEGRQITSLILDYYSDFVKHLKEQAPGLTVNELLLSCLFRMSLPAEIIASTKGISQASLNVSRSRLKNKLGIKEGKNLEAYLHQF
jgi:hypothetical protein